MLRQRGGREIVGNPLDDKRIALLGAGAMAEALAGGLLATGFPAGQLCAADPVEARRKVFADGLGVRAVEDNSEAVADADIVVVAVKPDQVRGILTRLKGDPDRPLWISIAAGVTLDRLKSALSASARIVRAMPNTPAQVRAGATGLCPSSTAKEGDVEAARALFEGVGTVWLASSEDQLDAVTGLSGSGPAYVFLFIEALADAGVRSGLPRDAAHQLACQTVFGSAKLALESEAHPAQLKDQVTSPGGTTIAGVERLEAGGFRTAVFEAVKAATNRSRELRGPDLPGKGPR
jgi:pyrroline-5-carboxylate reductase